MVKFIVCVEDRMGIAFNNRLIGRDKYVDEYIAELLNSGEEVFAENNYLSYLEDDRIHPIESFFERKIDIDQKGEENIYVFCSGKESLKALKSADEIRIYFWNRRYPADTFLDYDFVRSGFELIEEREAEGSTHELSIELWRKKSE